MSGARVLVVDDEPQILRALQIKLGTIKSRVHRARLFLRSRLADYMARAPQPR